MSPMVISANSQAAVAAASQDLSNSTTWGWVKPWEERFVDVEYSKILKK